MLSLMTKLLKKKSITHRNEIKPKTDEIPKKTKPLVNVPPISTFVVPAKKRLEFEAAAKKAGLRLERPSNVLQMNKGVYHVFGSEAQLAELNKAVVAMLKG